ncbi:MAG: M42 family metallopeptidase [Eubacteriaceae bacterium]|nr:M42 family metallopeptidase [Eubacteriaceae bacterium]
MEQLDLDFLKSLIKAPSPSGYEQPAARIVRERLSTSADSVSTDVVGNVYGILKGKSKGPSVLIAGHMDEIGMQVHYISDEGFVSFSAIGGIDASILPGSRVKIITKSGPVTGIIGKMPPHLTRGEDPKVPTIDKLCIDTGFGGEKAKELIAIGDPITFDSELEEFGDGFAVSRAFDDKLGVYIAVRTLEEVKKAGGANVDLIAVATVQEEIGLRGGATIAYSQHPDIGISAEVSHASDYPDMDAKRYGTAICGKGPLICRGANINPEVFSRMVAAAEKAGAPYQIEAAPGATGTDANAFQIARGGKAAGLISIPLRYMHSPVETIKLEDLENAVKILAQFVLDLNESTDLTPM